MRLRLFYSPGACSLVPHIALEEADAEFEAVRVTISEGAHHRPDYLKVNPRGLVPALDCDGRIVTENVAILALIGRRFPASGLVPEDDFGFARLLELISFFACSVHVGAFRPLFLARRAGSSWSAAEEQALVGYFREIDALLAPGPWLLGESYCVADGYPLTFRRWGQRLGFEMNGYAHWTKHAGRMVERPAVRRALEREGLDPAEFAPA